MIHGVLVVDKPGGISSHAVVTVARRALGTRRVGHAGTLDPMATGVLVLAVGEGLKIVRYLTLDDKRYAALIGLGSETDTLDADGSVTERAAVPELTRALVAEVARRFEGAGVQRAPLISALKRDGVPLYARVRRGQAVEAPERAVVVHALAIRRVQADEIELEVACGKGFYVRALARDLARALGTVGHLARLRRLQSGGFELRTSVEFALIKAAAAGDEAARAQLEAAALPIERALTPAPCVRLDAIGAEDARHGRPVAIEHALDCVAQDSAEIEPVLLSADDGALLAVARRTHTCFQIVRGFVF